MEHRKTGDTDIHYYSDRLKRKLSNLRTSHFAIVEAPSGYGKTTAVRDFLESALPRDTPVFWFATAEEATMSSFRRFCRVIGEIDAGAGQKLLKTGYNAAVVGETCDALRSIRCRRETYLVIDNFQFMQPNLPVSLFSALLEHGGEGLHIIVITQMLARNLTAAAAGRAVLRITASDLRLQAEDIRRYFDVSGAPVSADGANEIARRTEGWIAAVRLTLSAYRETGSYSDTTSIYTLMEHLVWDALTAGQQVFLMRLSPFGTVTAYQACAICGWDTLPEYARDALDSPFIRYEGTGRHYELHAILSGILAQKRRERGDAFDRECLLAAGDCCRDECDAVRAMDFYAQAGDYERMLRLDLSALYFETIGAEPFYELALRIARECPSELKQKYPLSMLRIAFELLAGGMNVDFGVLLDELYPMIDKNGDGDPLLRGEWLLLFSLRHLPRLDEMMSVLKQAAELFAGGHSRVILPDSPWFYCIFAPFTVFHSVPGEADREADALEEYIALYTGLTNGHGAGADVLFRAELAHYRGHLREAEIQAYKALYIAQSMRQKAIWLAASFHLAEIALESADTAGWKNAVASIEESLDGLQNIFLLPSAVDTVKGMLLSELGRSEEIADWLKDGDFSERQLPSMEIGRTAVHLGTLLDRGKYARIIGAAEAMHPEGIQIRGFQDIYLALIVAVAYLRSGNREKALRYADRAVRAAMADGLFLQLLYYGHLLDGLGEECLERSFPEQMKRFEAEKKKYLSAYSSVFPGLSPKELPKDLTAREREIALLAARGLKNCEIAEELFVTENTVRTHLHSVYQKLDIDRRAKLAEKLLKG